MAYADMSQEQIFIALQNDNAQMKAEMIQMKQLMDQANAATAGATGKGGDWHQGQGAWEHGGKGWNGRVVLDEKYFRRCDKFEGTPAKFKSWVFDLVIQLGSVHQELGRGVRAMLKSRNKIEVENIFHEWWHYWWTSFKV